MKPERTVLMICYYFPPILATGCNRSVAFATLLPSFGWRPIVLTVKNPQEPWERVGSPIPENVRIHRAREWNIVKLFDFCHAISLRLAKFLGFTLKRNWFRELLAIPDSQISWAVHRSALRLSREADVIYVSCSPFSAALVGVFLKCLSGKPLVLDFRDAWTLNPHVEHSLPHRAVIHLWERLALWTADHLVVNSDGTKRVYLQKYPKLQGKILVIANGYDRLTPVQPAAEDPFVVMHVGSFYGERNPEHLLEAMAKLSDLPIEFVQVGGSFTGLERFAERVNIRIIEPLPREEALQLLSQASLLYLKQGFEPQVKDYIAVAAKTYEYLATGLPILADVPEGDNAEVVRRYSRRSYVVTSNSAEQLEAALRQAYAERHSGKIGVTEEFVHDFDRQRLCGLLAEVLDTLTEGLQPVGQ